ncbi:MAG: MFS transporter [Myxococcales bacterium]|nr:MFS transporter [Myxococcales bacterium]
MSFPESSEEPKPKPKPERAKAPPHVWVPTTYFAEGYPYTIVNNVADVLFKELGAPLGVIGLTSLFHLPWNLKFLWGPLLDRFETKRRWLVGIELAIVVVLLGIAIFAPGASSLPLLAPAFMVLAVLSATHDIAIDGYYLEALGEREQSRFVGLRAMAYKLASLLVRGPLLVLIGFAGWTMGLLGMALVMLAILGFHALLLPEPEQRRVPISRMFAREPPTTRQPLRLLASYRQFFAQPKALLLLGFVLFFRTGESFLQKMKYPFLVDRLHLSVGDYGFINGTLGLGASFVGTLLGGWLIARHGLRRWIWPFVAMQNVLNLLYVYLANTEDAVGKLSVTVVVATENFGEGLGTAVFMVYLMRCCDPRHKAAHMAILTALMSVSFTVAGVTSGYLAEALGFTRYFFFSFLASVPSMLLLFFIPYLDGRTPLAASAPESAHG